jgi:hypothetical protein
VNVIIPPKTNMETQKTKKGKSPSGNGIPFNSSKPHLSSGPFIGKKKIIIIIPNL